MKFWININIEFILFYLFKKKRTKIEQWNNSQKFVEKNIKIQ